MNKYKNKKVLYNGILFDSGMEKDFYIYLLENNKKDDIILQPKFIIQDKFTDSSGRKHRAILYKSDFQIDDLIYDVKGMETPAFKLKYKLFSKKYPNLKLMCITKAPKYTGKKWIELSELKEIRRKRKKQIISLIS